MGRRILAVLGALALWVVSTGVSAQPPPPLIFDTTLVGYTDHDNPYITATYRQIAVDSTGRVHMAWNESPPGSNPAIVRYNSWFAGQNMFADSGCIWDSARTNYIPLHQLDLALDGTTPLFANREILPEVTQNSVVHRLDGNCEWSAFPVAATFGNYSDYYKPDIAVHRDGGNAVYHVVAVSPSKTSGRPTRIGYWRSTTLGEDSFQVVDSISESMHSSSVQIVTSPVSDRVAIIFMPFEQVFNNDYVLFYESLDGGITWGGGGGFGIPDTAFTATGKRPQFGLTAAYDYDDSLHIVFQEFVYPTFLPNLGGPLMLFHWSRATGATLVGQALFEPSGRPNDYRDINHPQLAVGTGEHLNKLYVIWEQVGTPFFSNADTSANGLLNSEIYLAVSTDGGLTWDLGRNITNSFSPDCAGDCASEVYPTVAEVVDSFVHILYQIDLETGDDVGDQTPSTTNPYYYMRLQTPDPVLRPLIVGLPNTLPRLFLRAGESDTIVITLSNQGVVDLEFTFSETTPWLSYAGGSETHTDTLAPGEETDVLIIADANALADGGYTAPVFMITNDPANYAVQWDVRLVITSDTTSVFDLAAITGDDCWGWTAPDGTEYAFMGISDGFVSINVDTRGVAGFIPVADCFLHDIKTFGHYAYMVDGCGAGMLIIDLQYLPDSLLLVGEFTYGSHNMTIDTVRGFAYLCDPQIAYFRVFDLNDPESPVEYPNVLSGFVHDLYARNDTIWAAEGNAGAISIWDMTDKNNAQLIARFSIPSAGFVHNVWPNRDGSVLVTTEESFLKTVKIWDASDLNNVQLASEYLAPSGVAHNAHVEGDFLYISHYESGVRVLDISDPWNPVERASFDTYPEGDSSNFIGCWGIYPHTQNGLIYASNTDGKLFIMDFTDSLPDVDLDRVADVNDNCLNTQNPTQADSDGDGIGDVCDNCPTNPNPVQEETDGDGVADSCDNCPLVINVSQDDLDSDGIGDLCDLCPTDSLNDIDGDSICYSVDNCPSMYNPDQSDTNSNGIGDVCDCACDCHADPVCEGITDVFDVLGAVSVAFQNGSPIVDPSSQCPFETTDVTCDNVTDVFDVLGVVAVAFQNADPAVEYCDPCAL